MDNGITLIASCLIISNLQGYIQLILPIVHILPSAILLLSFSFDVMEIKI